MFVILSARTNEATNVENRTGRADEVDMGCCIAIAFALMQFLYTSLHCTCPRSAWQQAKEDWMNSSSSSSSSSVDTENSDIQEYISPIFARAYFAESILLVCNSLEVVRH